MKLTGLITERKYPQIVLYFAIFAAIIRLAAIILFADLKTPEMWEFGIIARNLLNGEGFTYFALTKNVVSAYMPPGLPYIYFFFFSILGDNYISYFLILALNAILSCISVLLVYKLSILIFDEFTSRISAIYTALSPIYILSAISFNSIIIYHVLLLLLLYSINLLLIQKTNNSKINKTIIIIAFISGIFLYFRAESIFFIIILCIFFAYKKQFFRSVFIISISMLIIFPWSYRNFEKFGKIIPVTTSFGYNFYYGHGDDESTINYKKELGQIPEDSLFEIKKSDLSLKTALNYIYNNPVAETKESFKKIFSLWFWDTYRDTSREPLYLIIWLPTLFMFFTGIIYLNRNHKKQPLLYPVYIYLILSTILVLVFFNIPRYQIQMSIVMVPIAMFGLTNILKIIKNRK